MQKHKQLKTNKLCIGTGLVALDVILNGNPKTPPRLYTGGSCGNVLTILAYLGWKSAPIARLANNSATEELENDLIRWNVNTNLLTKSADGSTPIIIHRILKDKQGNPKHRFEFRNPDTGKWFPQYKPVLHKNVPSIIEQSRQTPNFFYFDRINRASIELAKRFKSDGALVFFEPSSVGGSQSMFEECLETTDILKFSNDRIPNYSDLFPKRQALLEIRTLGKDGLEFRSASSTKDNMWQTMKPYAAANVLDAAGAGDWCSAGIIDSLAECKELKKAPITSIKSALSFGQALGAINCSYDGARGAMYNLDVKKVRKMATTTIKTRSVVLIPSTSFPFVESRHVKLSDLI